MMADEVLYSDSLTKDFFQGDIFKGKIIAPSLVKDSDQNFSRPVTDLAIIITQTCDIQRREFVHLCPLYSIKELESDLKQAWDENRVNNFTSQIKKNKIEYYFHLPAYSDALVESFADINYIQTIPRKDLNNLVRLCGLSDYGRQNLAYRVGNIFLRPH